MIINPQLPNGHVTFCDDVRYELYGKTTLVGVYGPDMQLFGEAPLILSELHAVVQFNVDPESVPLNGAIKVIKSGSEEILCQQDFAFPQVDFDLPNMAPHPEEFQKGYHGLTTHFVIRDVAIEEPCRLKVRAFVGEDEIRIGSLLIGFAPPAETQR